MLDLFDSPVGKQITNREAIVSKLRSDNSLNQIASNDYSDEDDDLDIFSDMQRDEKETEGADNTQAAESQQGDTTAPAEGGQVSSSPSAAAPDKSQLEVVDAQLHEMRSLAALAAERAGHADKLYSQWYYAQYGRPEQQQQDTGVHQQQQGQQQFIHDPEARRYAQAAYENTIRMERAQQSRNLDIQAQESLKRFRANPEFEDFDKHVPAQMVNLAMQAMRSEIARGNDVTGKVDFDKMFENQYRQSHYAVLKTRLTEQSTAQTVSDKHKEKLEKLGNMPKGGGAFQEPKPKNVDPRKQDNRIGTAGFRDRLVSRVKELLPNTR